MSFNDSLILPDGWRMQTVGELVEDGILAKPLDGNHGGIHPKASDYVEQGIPFVMASDLEGGRVDLTDCKFISEDQARTLRKGFAKVGDVLLSHKATIGRTAIVQDSEFPFLMLTPQVTYYRINDTEKLVPNYIKAFFDSNFFQTILAQWAGAGSTRAYLGITGQLKLPIIVPPIEFQSLVASQAEALNGKIQINQQINQTLQQMAQTIFKSWFVDFEPVKAKIAAKQRWLAMQPGNEPASPVCYASELMQENSPHDLETTMTLAAMEAISGKDEAQLTRLQAEQPEQYAELRATSELFPSAMQDIETGEIPEGWNLAPFFEVAKMNARSVKPSDSPDQLWEHFSIPAFDENRAPSLDLGEEIKSNKYRVDPNSVLVSKLNPHFPRIWWPDPVDQEAAVCSTEFMQFIPKSSEMRPFVAGIIDSHPFQQGILSRVTGSTGSRQRAQPKQIAVMDVVLPPEPLILEYSKRTAAMYTTQAKNIKQAQNLAELRDTLLPKLLSGELSVSDAESQLSPAESASSAAFKAL
ncbi:MAG: restriction endonuclease subunit S [Pseudomonadota bacterium]